MWLDYLVEWCTICTYMTWRDIMWHEQTYKRWSDSQRQTGTAEQHGKNGWQCTKWSRSQSITVTQLRMGHCPLLASYLHRRDSAASSSSLSVPRAGMHLHRLHQLNWPSMHMVLSGVDLGCDTPPDLQTLLLEDYRIYSLISRSRV